MQIHRTMLLAAACMTAGLGVRAQVPDASFNPQPTIEVSANFDVTRANTVAGATFWMQGGDVQLSGRFTSHLAVAADVSGLHTARMPGTAAALDMVTAAFGPRFILTSSNGRVSVYGQALGGVANGFNSIFPGAQGASSSANGFVVQMGGGMESAISRHLGLHLLDVEWLRTDLSNGTTFVQNSMRLGTGMVFRF
jgi:outer membrane immunogenic protein